MNASAAPAPLLRIGLGDALRDLRRHQGHILCEISSDAQIFLGYPSGAERGQKEASSKLLEAVCLALSMSPWFVLYEVSERMTVSSSIIVPDTVSEDLVPVTLVS